ncbi:MAG: lipoxygenase family protein, partial [Qipengyuania vulgaris]
KLKGILELRGATKAALGQERPRTLENYLDNFKTIPVPGIAYTFQDDLEFAHLRVAGPNSVLIEAAKEVPQGCAVTPEQYTSVVAGDTLEAAVEQGRLFQCDYSPLSIIEPGEWDGLAKYLTCPIALFAVPPGGDSLVPVAINCDPSNAASPVMTPTMASDKAWGWEMAKLVVQVADGNYHELFAHLARTHLVIEAIAVATHRHLADVHPLNALLVRHFEGTMFINEAAATTLITPGGPIDHIFAGTIATSQKAAVEARLSFDFAKGMLPQDIAARGVGADSPLANYPYRDDGLLVWGVIETWVGEYVRTYYAQDGDVTGDTELQAWAQAIVSSGKLKGFTAPTTIQDVIDLVTMTVFTASAQHASVNFPQKAIMEYAPAVTGALWQTAPDNQSGNNKPEWLAMMAPEALALEQLKTLYLLGSLYYRPLGTYLSPQYPYPQWFQDPKIIGEDGPLSRFQAALANVEEQIVARNAERRRPYTFLLPSLIPSSTNI